MIKFSEASLGKWAENFMQMPNRRLTMENSLEDIHEAKELFMEIKKHDSYVLERREKYKNNSI